VFELGVDLALYSATKSIAGHSDVLAGLVTGSRAVMVEVHAARTVFGPNLDPTSAWLIERSLKTMPLRVRAANTNALELARRLQAHPRVAQVFHPGLPSHPTHAIGSAPDARGLRAAARLRGGRVGRRRRCGWSRRCASSGMARASAASSRSPIWPRSPRTRCIGPEGRARAGIPEGLVRLSAGIESLEDLWADLEQGLAKA
jgi:cystathionine beta-lyase/cystathionine gamma-synthase